MKWQSSQDARNICCERTAQAGAGSSLWALGWLLSTLSNAFHGRRVRQGAEPSLARKVLWKGPLLSWFLRNREGRQAYFFGFCCFLFPALKVAGLSLVLVMAVTNRVVAVIFEYKAPFFSSSLPLTV